MWLSEKAGAAGSLPDAAVETGKVSIGGKSPAVILDGERRNLGVMGYGGLAWIPKAEQEAIVLHCGDGMDVVAGIMEAPPSDMLPGEIFISTGAASLYVRANGQVNITGSVNITGGLTVNGIPVTGLPL